MYLVEVIVKGERVRMTPDEYAVYEEARLKAKGAYFDPSETVDGNYRSYVGGPSREEFEARQGTALAPRGRLVAGDPQREGVSRPVFDDLRKAGKSGR